MVLGLRGAGGFTRMLPENRGWLSAYPVTSWGGRRGVAWVV